MRTRRQAAWAFEMPVESKATRFPRSSQRAASGRPLEATNDRSIDATAENPAPQSFSFGAGRRTGRGRVLTDAPPSSMPQAPSRSGLPRSSCSSAGGLDPSQTSCASTSRLSLVRHRASARQIHDSREQAAEFLIFRVAETGVAILGEGRVDGVPVVGRQMRLGGGQDHALLATHVVP